MAHYVYLIQDANHISSGLNIYKVGKTTLLPHQRMTNYTKNSIAYAFMVVRDCHVMEEILLKIFASKFKQLKKIGKEWFEGDIVEMKICFTMRVLEEYKLELADKKAFLESLPCSPSEMPYSSSDEEAIELTVEKPIVIEKLKIVQGFTKEYIGENMSKLTDDLIKQGVKGISKFLLEISSYENERIYKCIDSSKNKFSRRLPDGTWEDDLKGHMLNYIFNFIEITSLEVLGNDKNVIEFTKAINSSTNRTKYIRLVLNTVKFEMENL